MDKSEYKNVYGDRLINGNVMVEWVELGEGWCGDYNEDDPEDEELLRFDVSYWYPDADDWNDGVGNFGDPGDCSYCTRFPAKSTPEQRQKGLEYLMHNLEDIDFENGYGKRMCERLSWIGLDWVEEGVIDEYK